MSRTMREQKKSKDEQSVDNQNLLSDIDEVNNSIQQITE